MADITCIIDQYEEYGPGHAAKNRYSVWLTGDVLWTDDLDVVLRAVREDLCPTPGEPPVPIEDALAMPAAVTSDRRPTADGDTYDPPVDQARLGKLQDRVRILMGDGEWRTLSEVQHKVGGSEASCSARLRDLRKEGRIVERRRRGAAVRGLWEYRLMPVAEQRRELPAGFSQRDQAILGADPTL